MKAIIKNIKFHSFINQKHAFAQRAENMTSNSVCKISPIHGIIFSYLICADFW